MDTTTLAERITSRLPHAAAVAREAFDIAEDLRTLGHCVPADDWLIVGGSLARGEPTFIRIGGKPLLISDVDLLYVHYGDHPSTQVHDLMAIAEKYFATVDLMTLPLSDYLAIQTSLGHDFKNLGLPVTDRGLPEHHPVTLDVRDAYEILLYYTQAYFWLGLHDQWRTGAASTHFHLLISRLCVKILRATAMLEGAYAHHDFGQMAPHLAEQMRAELRWRADPTQPPMDPGRFWTYLHHAFTRFDTEFGQPRPDAVNYTRYAVTSSGRIVARHHQTVHALARAMADAWHTTPGPTALTTVKQRAWERITGWTGSARRESPEDHFRAHKQTIHDHLLAMKVQVR
ncbi:hypothetical protein [Nocardia gamkensis]|uniref:Nucleotidyltransferase n=1 Tax=Nocardia gamkensis TaxID=352869 RepID=A0A7X6LBH8_9NOCA|nr:hypothetical protein [Nocardia gamkensis]NKY31407.1 hypothetical protein [Nocardia gamkensis]NQE72493.1 hypothetical protein [Nocardia gamkensis]